MNNNLIVLILSSFSLVALVVCYIKDYNFYKKRNWNFLSDRPGKIARFFSGDMVGEVSNRQRVLVYLPFLIAFASLFFIVSLASLVV